MNDSHNAVGWRYDSTGAFILPNPHQTNHLYFPLANEAGMLSVITPMLHGDVKTGQNSFLTTPVSVEDLRTSRAARNFWVSVQGKGAWSVTGQSASQIAATFAADAERVTLHAGFLWHKLTRESEHMGLRAEIINFVPPADDRVELMSVTLTNVSGQTLTLTPTAAIPIFGRSADNLRDHRHVTSLLHRIVTHRYGVLVRPTMSFDERGHQPNTLTYAVLGAEGNGAPPQAFYPLIDHFIGEGGSLEWPEAVVAPRDAGVPAGREFAGAEAVGALRFESIQLVPGQSRSYVILLSIMDPGDTPERLIQAYGSRAAFDSWFERNQAHWQGKLDALTFSTGDRAYDQWLKWVALQPILRRIFGNSFMPYHDYGRGGRGWRDLWQDCLALLMMEPDRVPDLLFGSFAGVRVDGSNATIIGARPGEFKADRNNIARIWMDHGAWPFLTTRLYLDQSGDLDFLLRDQSYFKDQHIQRAQGIDAAWQPEQGTCQQTAAGQVYQGTVLEHMLIQHLTAFFNVGAHNNIKLEGADWNDGLDMAADQGESVAFTALYASNLRDLSQLAFELDRRGVTQLTLAAELMPLLDTLGERVNYDSVADKQQRLHAYMDTCAHTLSGVKNKVPARALTQDLAAKADWLTQHLRAHEWIRNAEGFEWFNGYYDNDGARVEGDHPKDVRMTLTGQVFALMGGIATPEQTQHIVRSVDRYLLDPAVGGYRLNTNFHETRPNLGRCFAFAYGTKENGAMFSHMAIMYANALYRRGRVREGWRVLEGIYRHCSNFEVSRMYPGIPEYVDGSGRGAYAYLTGSASWLLLTLVTESFGVQGRLGDLALEPKLVPEQFDANGQAAVETLFAGKKLRVVYHNPDKLDYGTYEIASVQIDGQPAQTKNMSRSALLARETIAVLDGSAVHQVDVILRKVV